MSPRNYQDEDDEAEEESDPDERHDPDESDTDDDEGDERAETVPCPYCRKPVYEQAEVCPSCGNYISGEDAPRRRPWWIWLGVALCLIVVVLVWVFSGP